MRNYFTAIALFAVFAEARKHRDVERFLEDEPADFDPETVVYRKGRPSGFEATEDE